MCPLTLVLALGYNFKEPSSIFVTHSLQVFTYVDKVLPESFLLQDEQSKLSLLLLTEVLQSLQHLGSPPLDSSSLLHWGAHNWS